MWPPPAQQGEWAPPRSWVLQRFRRQDDLAPTEAARQIKQRVRNRAARIEDQRALVRQGALQRLVIVGDDGGNRDAQRPANLRPGVVMTGVVAGQDEGQSLIIQMQLVTPAAQSSPGLPEAEQVR